VAKVSTLYKQALLEWFYSQAEASGAPLIDILRGFAFGLVKKTSTGQFIIETSGNGGSVTLATPTSGSITGPAFGQIELTEVAMEIITRYRAAVSALGGGGTDAEIVAEIAALMVPVHEIHADLSELARG
jgi:hypothetical protein